MALVSEHIKLFQVGSCVDPQGVFQAYVEKLFWEGEQKPKEGETDQLVSNLDT